MRISSVPDADITANPRVTIKPSEVDDRHAYPLSGRCIISLCVVSVPVMSVKCDYSNYTGNNISNVSATTTTGRLCTVMISECVNCITDGTQMTETALLKRACSVRVTPFLMMIKRYAVTVHAVATLIAVFILSVIISSSFKHELHVCVLWGRGYAYSHARISAMEPYTDSDNTPAVSYDYTIPSPVITNDNVLGFIPNDISPIPITTEHFVDSSITRVLHVRIGGLWGEEPVDVSQAESEAVKRITDGEIRYIHTSHVLSVAATLSDKADTLASAVCADRIKILAVTSCNTADLLNSAIYDNPDDVIRVGSTFVHSQDVASDEAYSWFVGTTNMTAIGLIVASYTTAQEVRDKVQGALGMLSNVYTLDACDAVLAPALIAESVDTSLATDVVPSVLDGYSRTLGTITPNDAGDPASIIYELWGITDGK